MNTFFFSSLSFIRSKLHITFQIKKKNIQYNQPNLLAYVKLKHKDKRVFVFWLHAFRYQARTKIMFLVDFLKWVLVRIRTRQNESPRALHLDKTVSYQDTCFSNTKKVALNARLGIQCL